MELSLELQLLELPMRIVKPWNKVTVRQSPVEQRTAASYQVLQYQESPAHWLPTFPALMLTVLHQLGHMVASRHSAKVP